MIDELPIHLITRMYKEYLKKQKYLLSEFDLTEHHIIYLMIIYKSDGMRMTELAELLDVDKANVPRIIKKLEDSGYIIRDIIKSGERKYKVYLSDSGKKLLNNCNQAKSIMPLNY